MKTAKKRRSPGLSAKEVRDIRKAVQEFGHLGVRVTDGVVVFFSAAKLQELAQDAQQNRFKTGAVFVALQETDRVR